MKIPYATNTAIAASKAGLSVEEYNRRKKEKALKKIRAIKSITK